MNNLTTLSLSNQCVICQNKQLIRVFKSAKPAAVASDSRPLNYPFSIFQCSHCQHYQKIADASYQQKVINIYSSYQDLHLTQRSEQLIFSANVPKSRCQMILENCQAYFTENECSKVLDVGTGSGVMLNALSDKWRFLTSSCQFFAQDVSEHQKSKLQTDYAIKQFYLSLETIEEQFDLITIIHVLEHVFHLDEMLEKIVKLLSKNGKVIFQVPNIESNEWDFAIYDHISHFSIKTLTLLLKKHFPYVNLTKEQLDKEITVIASKSPISNRLYGSSNTDSPLHEQKKSPIDKFSHIFYQLNELAGCEEQIAILGTGPSASFAGLCLIEKMAFWLDEDTSKVRKKFCDHEIKLLADVNSQQKIFLPYPIQQVEQIIRRYPSLNFCYINEVQG